MPIHKVALIGASGTLGPAVLAALQASAALSTTVLVRASSKSPLPQGVPTLTVPDDFSVASLTSTLRGFDAVVSTLPGFVVEPHKNLATACAAAGVRRFVPADYGSVDSSDEVVQGLVPLYRQKCEVRARCEELAAESKAGFGWTSIVCGHFFDYGLKSGLLGIRLREGKATVFDSGELKWSATTLARVGEAVVKVLTVCEAESENRMLYVQSFALSQLDVIEAIMNTSSRQMDVDFVKSEVYIEEKKEKLDNGDKSAEEDLVGVLGMTRADWRGKEGFANKMMGFEDEDLHKILKQIYMSYVEDQRRKK